MHLRALYNRVMKGHRVQEVTEIRLIVRTLTWQDLHRRRQMNNRQALTPLTAFDIF